MKIHRSNSIYNRSAQLFEIFRVQHQQGGGLVAGVNHRWEHHTVIFILPVRPFHEHRLRSESLRLLPCDVLLRLDIDLYQMVKNKFLLPYAIYELVLFAVLLSIIELGQIQSGVQQNVVEPICPLNKRFPLLHISEFFQGELVTTNFCKSNTLFGRFFGGSHVM